MPSASKWAIRGVGGRVGLANLALGLELTVLLRGASGREKKDERREARDTNKFFLRNHLKNSFHFAAALNILRLCVKNQPNISLRHGSRIMSS